MAGVGVYELARAYHVAFSYRDIPAEVDTLLRWFDRHAGGAPASVLELAAGPADHSRELARRGIAATALDLSPQMCAYAAELAAAEGVPLDVVRADMTGFDLGRQFDLVVLPLSSDAHLLDLDAFVANLTAVARHLRPGGLYVLEETHPADVLGNDGKTLAEWTSEGDGLTVRTRWGAAEDPVDPVTQLRRTGVELRVDDGTGERVHTDTVLERQWTLTEVTAAVRLSGAFDVLEWYGAYGDVLVTAPKAWRMIPVLRRR